MNAGKNEEKGKGISLRKKRTVKPKISAPKQISGPLPAGLAADQRRIANASPAGGLPAVPRPREKPQNGDRTADLVKRRYSTRFTNLPQNFNAGGSQLPSVPSLPSQFAVQPPSRDGQAAGLRLKVDAKTLSDPQLKPEQCKLIPFQTFIAIR
jgi:hypothetical protein